MTRAILFDLGDTLLDSGTNRPLPGATELLQAVVNLRDAEGDPVLSALVSDWKMPHHPSDVGPLREEYLDDLRAAGLDSFFQPLDQRVTLSTEVGVHKPDRAIFHAALERLGSGLSFQDAVFVTENLAHVQAARALGLPALHFKGPGQTTGEVEQFPELLEALKRITSPSPTHKKAGAAVGLSSSVATKSKQADPATTALVAQVSAVRLRDRIKALSDFGTRWTSSSAIGEVAEWLTERFLEMGYPSSAVRPQPFSVAGAPQQRNVLCGVDASHPGFVLVCAHYDSISEASLTNAPGADDNASGVAVLLEVASLLKTVALRRGVLYVAFAAEEQGLLGSEACAEIAARDDWHIDVVVNLDMIAFQDSAHPQRIRVEYDQGNRNPGNDAAAMAFGFQMAQAAKDYTTLEVVHTDIWNSDYMPFEAKGYACIGVFEDGENPGYHKTTDTADRLDMNHLADVTKMVLAAIYQIAR